MGSTPSSANVDQAALALATVAAAVTLASAPGPYDWATTAIAITLLFVTLAYYHPRADNGGGLLGGPGRDAAFGAVIGLLSAMAISWFWSATVARSPGQCQDLQDALGRSHDLAAEADLKASLDRCLGEAVEPWFRGSWLLLAIVAGLLHAHARRKAVTLRSSIPKLEDRPPSPDLAPPSEG
jgi:hypothetical protein